MSDSPLMLLGWNAAIAGALAMVVVAIRWLPAVRRRPALQHSLWVLVLVTLVTPPLIPLPVLATAAVEDENATEVATPMAPTVSENEHIDGVEAATWPPRDPLATPANGASTETEESETEKTNASQQTTHL